MDDTCREILASLRTYLDGECPHDIEEAVANHLVDCPPCLERADFERELKQIVRHKCQDHAPDGLVDRIVKRIGS